MLPGLRRWWNRSAHSHSRSMRTAVPKTRLNLESLESREVPAALVALDTNNNLIRFDSESPTNITTVAITGLAVGTGESVVGIDFRPRTGQLYALSVVNTGGTDNLRLYTLNVLTGVATQVGTSPIPVTAGTFYGFDFNPTVDRIRVVNTADENLRLNPNTGARADDPTSDTDLNPSGSLIDGAAYDRNFDGLLGANGTTLYGIARNGNALVTVGGVNQSPSPNGGQVMNVGSLGVTISAAGGIGFDIAPLGTAGGTGFAVFTDNGTGQTGLYTIDLATGAATLVGLVGNGTIPLEGLAIVPESTLAVGVTGGGGVTTTVRVLNSTTDAPTIASITPFVGFQGAVSVGYADVNRDSVPDVIVGATAANGHVKVFDGATGAEIMSFFAFQGFNGAVNVAGGDINGDGFADIIVGASAANGHVKVFSGADGSELASFFAFVGFNGSTAVGAADFDNNGTDELIVGAGGPGANGHIKTFSIVGGTTTLQKSFFAFQGFGGPITISGGDINGDGQADILVGAGGAPGGHVKVFSGAASNDLLASFFAFEAGYLNGVSVTANDFNLDGRSEIRVAPLANRVGEVRTFDGITAALVDTFLASGTNTGIAIAGARR